MCIDVSFLSLPTIIFTVSLGFKLSTTESKPAPSIKRAQIKILSMSWVLKTKAKEYGPAQAQAQASPVHEHPQRQEENQLKWEDAPIHTWRQHI